MILMIEMDSTVVHNHSQKVERFSLCLRGFLSLVNWRLVGVDVGVWLFSLYVSPVNG